MSKLFYRSSLFGLALLAGLFLLFYSIRTPLPSPKSEIQIYSTHNRDDLKLTLLNALKKAQKSIYLRTYALTDISTLSALKRKAQEGVDVHLTYHKKTTPKLDRLESPHFHFYPIQERGLMHEKIWIIDESQVFLGSANVTYSSLKMHDNCILGFYSPEFAKALTLSRPENLSLQIQGQTVQYFSLPNKKALDMLLETLGQANERVSLSLFTFTHPLIVKKLIELHERGVKIELTVDAYTARGSSKKAVTSLSQAGVPIRRSRGVQLFHHKWALIDDHTLILGSANWTQAAFTKNRDFILFLSPLTKGQLKRLNHMIKKIKSLNPIDI